MFTNIFLINNYSPFSLVEEVRVKRLHTGFNSAFISLYEKKKTFEFRKQKKGNTYKAI